MGWKRTNTSGATRILGHKSIKIPIMQLKYVKYEKNLKKSENLPDA